MKTYTTESGQLVVTGDEAIVIQAEGVSMTAPFWTYTVPNPEDSENPTKVVVDISSHRPNLQVLAGLYNTAEATKRPEDAAAYVRHRDRVIALFDRMAKGERYEQ